MINETNNALLQHCRHARYSIDSDQLVRAEFKRLGYENSWRPVLIADESYSGCRIIVTGEDCGEAGEMLRVDFGSESVEVEIVRVERLAPKVHSLGCRFVLGSN